MKRDREVFIAPDVDWVRPENRPPYNPRVSREVYERALEYFDQELLGLYYPDLYVFPEDDPDTEIYINFLYTECYIGVYGSWEHKFNYENEKYRVIIVNND